MTHSVQTTLPFKGTRTYLHGTSIIDMLATELEIRFLGVTEQKGEIVFHSFARHQCDLMLPPRGKVVVPPENAVTTFECSIGSEDAVIGWLVETRRLVTSSVPYPEEDIQERSSIIGKMVRLSAPCELDAIETVVALTKHLHNTLFPLDGKKWIFTKLEFDRFLNKEDIPGMEIEVRFNLHNRITKSAVRTIAGEVAQIYFSAVTS